MDKVYAWICAGVESDALCVYFPFCMNFHEK
jgi:hypothetical protein